MLAPCPETDAPTVESIYQDHATFVSLTLHRLGVRPADVEDVAHEVFLIVQRRLASFEGACLITTWLFGICRRVAANYRRRRRDLGGSSLGEGTRGEQWAPVPPDDLLTRVEDLAIANQILARLGHSSRHVFVMFEVETRSCPEIAEIMNIPVGTVYSRLHGARKQIEKIVADICNR